MIELNFTLHQVIAIYILIVSISIVMLICVKSKITLYKPIYIYKNSKCQRWEQSFLTTRTYGYGIFCGSFVFLLDRYKLIHEFDIVGVGLLLLSLFIMLGITIEEKIRIKRTISNSLTDTVEGMFYNFFIATAIHFIFNYEITNQKYIEFSLNFVEFSFNLNVINSKYSYIFLSLLIIGWCTVLLSFLYIIQAKRIRIRNIDNNINQVDN